MPEVNAIITANYQDFKCMLKLTSSDFDRINKLWDVEDELFKGLQSQENFENIKKWSQLTSEHYKLMILQNIKILLNSKTNDFNNTSSNLYNSLLVILTGYIKHIEKVSGSFINLITINLVSDRMMVIDTNISCMYTLKDLSKKKDPTFKVVIDNTK